MTKRHFEQLARVLAGMKHRTGISEPVRYYFAQQIARVCEAENQRFDFDRFMTAAGFPTSERTGMDTYVEES